MGCDSSPYRTPTANLPHNSYRTPTAAYRRPALLRLHSEALAKVRPRTHPPAQNRPRQLEGASAANKSQDSRLEWRRKTTTISHGPKNKKHLKMWLSSFPLGIDPMARRDFFRRIQFPEQSGNNFFRHRSETDNHNFTCPGQSQFHMEPAKLL